MKVAFVHDWLVTSRGGEKVLEALCEAFPEAPIYTLFYDSRGVSEKLRNKNIFVPKFLNRFRAFRKLLLPLLPTLIETLDLREYDLVISTSCCVAKGVLTRVDAKHVCYIHSPMRYIWDEKFTYLASIKRFPGVCFFYDLVANYLRIWDVISSHRVDLFLANSRHIQSRVRKFYGKKSVVLHPPLEDEKFFFKETSNPVGEKYFLAAGAFVYYKRFDLAIEACKAANVKLIVAGNGPLEKKFKEQSGGLIEVRTNCDDEVWKSLLQGAEALVFPGIEDFGMIGIEAMACGTPVIAYAKGGALDFIEAGINGEFFYEPSVLRLAEKIKNFNKSNYKSELICKSVEKFRKQNFIKIFKQEVEGLLKVEAYE